MGQAFNRYLAKAHSGFYSARSPAQIKYTRSPPNIINHYRGARRSAFFLLLLLLPLLLFLLFSFYSSSFFSTLLLRSFILLPLFPVSSVSSSPPRLSYFLLSFLVDPLFRPNRNSITSHLFYACVIVARDVLRVSSSRGEDGCDKRRRRRRRRRRKEVGRVSS